MHVRLSFFYCIFSVKMAISVAFVEKADIKELANEVVRGALNLRSSGGEMEWELLYQAGPEEREPFCSHYFDCSFQLMPRHGMNFMRTSSYHLSFEVENGCRPRSKAGVYTDFTSPWGEGGGYDRKGTWVKI
jgi:hypothetical protein